MDWFPYFLALTLVTVVLAAALGYLGWAHLRLKRELAELSGRLSRQNDDLMGLCTAAVQVDRRILEQEQRWRECLERLDSLPQQQAGAQPYHTAIEQVKRGAVPEDLVSEYGLSLPEAQLLARLYGHTRS